MKKNIITSSFLLLSTFAFSQVAIGKSTITTLSDNVTPNTSISLEFGTGNKGIILPWVTSKDDVAGAVNGTLIYDTFDKRVKVKLNSGWKDLSLDTTGVVDTSLQQALIESTNAKTQIGGNPTTDSTPGILVLADTNKAMILPKTTYNAIVNPEPGMMIYDTTAKQLAVFNGKVWSFWKP